MKIFKNDHLINSENIKHLQYDPLKGVIRRRLTGRTYRSKTGSGSLIVSILGTALRHVAYVSLMNLS